MATTAEVIEALQQEGLADDVIKMLVPILAYESRVDGVPYVLTAIDSESPSYGLGQANITSIGIGTNPDNTKPFRINDDPSERIFVSTTGAIGIKTTEVLPGVVINALTSNVSLGGVGIGVTTFTAAVDLQSAGAVENWFVILPKMNNSGRNGLQNVVSGAVIYNTSTNKMQVYNGSAWQDCN